MRSQPRLPSFFKTRRSHRGYNFKVMESKFCPCCFIFMSPKSQQVQTNVACGKFILECFSHITKFGLCISALEKRFKINILTKRNYSIFSFKELKTSLFFYLLAKIIKILHFTFYLYLLFNLICWQQVYRKLDIYFNRLAQINPIRYQRYVK